MMARWIAVLALCATPSLSAQTGVVLYGKVVTPSGAGVSSSVVIRSGVDSSIVLARAETSSGQFEITLKGVAARIVIEARTKGGLYGRVELDSASVAVSRERPVIIRLRGTQDLAPIQVRARFQRRPSIFGFFEGETSSRLEWTGPTATEWFDPLTAGGVGALLLSSPEMLITTGGDASLMGAPAISNQMQIAGVQVPMGLVSGLLNGNIAVSPWDVTVGGAAGATVNIFQGPAGRYRTSSLTVRSGGGGVPGWIRSGAQSSRSVFPAMVSVAATGPVGRFGYRANAFLKSELSRLPKWDNALGESDRNVLDSLAGILGVPALRSSGRNVQGGIIGRLDLIPFNSKRVVALTSALTRSTRNAASQTDFITGSVGGDMVEDVALLQLESSRVFGERVLSTSLVSTSWTQSSVARFSSAPTVVVTDPGQLTFITGGSPPQPKTSNVSVEARSTASWYSVNNRARYVAQIQTRFEHATVSPAAPHGIFTTSSVSALRSGQAFFLSRESDSPGSGASSLVIAPAGSGRFDLGKTGSLLVGVRVDAWMTSGVSSSGALRYSDLSPRASILRRLGTRSADRGSIATLRVGAGRFTDWPGVRNWSDAWAGAGTTREACGGLGIPRIELTNESPSCAGAATIQIVGRTTADGGLRPAAANRADASVAIAEIAPGVRAEFGAALAQNSRMSARLSPLANFPVLDRLTGENGRALLVPKGTIQADGLVPVAQVPAGIAGARRLESAARSTAWQWRARFATQDPFARTKVSVSYARTTGRERSLAIASPSGPPTFISGPLLSRGGHSLGFSISEWVGDAEVLFSGLARSGARFTPLSDRDLNGDGHLNDAAFVPGNESERWAGLVSAPARACVLANSGRIAGVGSCAGPWTISSLFVASIPGTHLGLRPGSSLDVQLSNPLAAVIRSSGRRFVFGDQATVNPFLVHITGFNAAEQRFLGEPIRGFGAPVGQSSGVMAPSILAVSIRIPLGASVTSQRADAALRAIQKDTSGQAKQGAALEYLGDLPPFPIVVLQSAEGIELTADQRGSLQALAGRWMASAASIVGDAMAETGGASDARTRKERLVRARATFLVEAADIAAVIRRLLTAEQVELLPEGVQRMLNPRFLRFLAGQDAATN